MMYNLPLPSGPYSIICCDPPWPYADQARAGRRGAGFKYALMSEADLLTLPVGSIAAPHCALFLWATPPNLPLALRVVASWDFQYKTVAFTWVKTSRDGQKSPIGMGNWTRANPEPVLLATRGRPRVINRGIRALVHAPRREHSRKPDEVRERIVALLGDLARIKLFARGPLPPGWDGWGAEFVSTPAAATDLPQSSLENRQPGVTAVAGRVAPHR